MYPACLGVGIVQLSNTIIQEGQPRSGHFPLPGQDAKMAFLYSGTQRDPRRSSY